MSAVFRKRSLRFYMHYREWRNNIKPEKKIRNYQHIDNPLNLDDEKIFKKVICVLDNIKSHQFLPFIKKEDVKIRFRKNNWGEARRSRKIRPIMYASHMDAHIYSYFNFIVSNKYEDCLKKFNLHENVIAYRKILEKENGRGKNNINFAKEVFEYIKKQNECVVITQDIEGFFDNLNHGLLKEKICKVYDIDKLEEGLYKVLRSLIAYKYIKCSDYEKNKSKIKNTKYAVYNVLKYLVRRNETNRGIPQGSPISGLLANVYLIDFDNAIRISFPDVFYRRYSDDLVFVCKRDRKDELISFIQEQIKKSMLKINYNKSYISFFKFNDGNLIVEGVIDCLGKEFRRYYVDYLGFEFDGKKIFFRKNTIQKLKNKQNKKVKKQLLNTQKPYRRKPKKLLMSKAKQHNNYFNQTVKIIDNVGVKRQVMRANKDRNKIKK